MGPDVENKEYRVNIPIIKTKNTIIKHVLQLKEIDKEYWRDIDEIITMHIEYESVISRWKTIIKTSKSKYMIYRIIERQEKIIFDRI